MCVFLIDITFGNKIKVLRCALGQTCATITHQAFYERNSK
jgi:hypothetical protein